MPARQAKHGLLSLEGADVCERLLSGRVQAQAAAPQQTLCERDPFGISGPSAEHCAAPHLELLS